MSVIYGNQNEDTKFASIVEPNLYYNSVFAPGKTFTDKYEEGPAGGIYVHKLATQAVGVGTPGRDFQDVTASDSLIQIVLNNNFQQSKKIYGVQAAAVSINLVNENLSIASQEVGEAWNAAGLACLIAEGTTASSTASITKNTVKKAIIDARKQIVSAKGRANVLLASPDTFACILEAAGSEFVPEMNEHINQTGTVGQWLGLTVLECAALAASSGEYYNAAGSKVTSSFSGVDFIMYNKDALSIITNLDAARVKDSENFVGSKAQVEINSGFKVTSAAQVVVH
jgi:hypothetical protein